MYKREIRVQVIIENLIKCLNLTSSIEKFIIKFIFILQIIVERKDTKDIFIFVIYILNVLY